MIWTKPAGNYVPAANPQLVGFNPFETYARQTGFIFPQCSWWKFQKISEKNPPPSRFLGVLWFTYVASGYFCSPKTPSRSQNPTGENSIDRPTCPIGTFISLLLQVKVGGRTRSLSPNKNAESGEPSFFNSRESSEFKSFTPAVFFIWK